MVYSLYLDPKDGSDSLFLYLAYSDYNDAFTAKQKLEEVYGKDSIEIDSYAVSYGYENTHCQGYNGD